MADLNSYKLALLRLPAMVLVGLMLLAAATYAGAQPPGCDAIDVFVRTGCPHCDAAKLYLSELEERFPGLTIELLNVADSQVRSRFLRLNEEHGVERPGVPTMLICGQLLTGFDPELSPPTVESLLLDQDTQRPDSKVVDLPFFGSVVVSELGLPLFTVMVGLVDGFNPCAMWVLLFLLSVLVNIRKRSRIVLVAGTFVAVSGFVYFMFMAAWLNMFLLIGLSRTLQMALGVVAIVIGTIHIKDFFAQHRGISLSIPDAAKPSLYARVRRIVHAEAVLPALVGATMLAAVVNLIELMCTAGLPALYTQVLTLYELPNVQYYGYLVLYNVAYMVDDAIMVVIAVVTLGHHKLQSTQGRWLKLLSGSVIAVLGAMMLFKPSWLVF